MKYDVIMIDPPWPKKKGGIRSACPNQTRELDYRTLSLADNFSLIERDILLQAAEQHTLFLWTVDEFLRDAEMWAESLGYRRHARIVWDKQNGVAPAFSIRFSHEYLLWYYKPKFTPVATESRGKLRDVLTEPAREHSRKPDEAYRFIETLYPNAAKLDAFSREKRDGWDQYGDQPNHFGGTAI